MAEEMSLKGDPTLFDTPEGTITLVECAFKKGAWTNIQKFYKDTLPNLGWKEVSANTYRRENTLLQIQPDLWHSKISIELKTATEEDRP